MKKNLTEITGNLLFIITRGNVKTNYIREQITIRKKQRNAENARIQSALDREHMSGKGIIFFDGKEKTYSPFSSANC